ncbi:nuclear pore complex protein Nup85-like [Lytechinus variegatus]|uniref:nuclear pore complex protein Nup85-like n=1 Tax=Lytechinus variegatus TaxID=7654 RepID=UPI001BB161B1|nr:nuclear pore complex protein Nup85-like [Lytechinus variegatus]
MAAYEREIPFLSIPESEASIHGLSAVWGRGNQLLLHTGCGQRRRAMGSADEVVYHQTPSRLHQVEWQTDMHNPHTRKLVMQSHDIFVSLQKQPPEHKDTSRKPQLIKCSRHYRAFIAECVQDLRKASLDPNIDRTEAREYGDQCEIFQTIGLIWSLCEILFVETLPGGIVLQQLLDWVKLHFTEGDVKARNVLMAEEIETTEEYWSAIYIYILQGRLTEARHMLSLDPKFQQDTHGAYGKIDELMRRMPVFGTLSRQSLAEFDLKWRHWQDTCRQCLEDHSFTSYPRLEVICKILCGDQSVLLQEVGDLIQELGGWYHLMVTRLLYTNPTVKALDLHYHAKASMDACGVTGRMTALDSILEKALEFDIYQMIKISSATLSNWWFVSHLADLLHHCGQLDSHQLNFGSDLREFLLLEYASTLMSHNSFWQVVADYLDYCSQFGRHYLELFIERIPLNSERKALKVLKACEDREMKEQAQSICKVLGMRCYRQGRLGSALTWCLRSHDPTFATYLADKFLTEYSLKGGFTNIDLLDNLGAGMLLSDRLTFLGKYREFHRLYEQGDFSDAAALLLSLLRARLAPKQFWLTLLTDALPLLELDEVVFSSKQTSELLRCHEELDKWFKSEEYQTQILPKKSKGQLELEKEKLELLQLGLSRNIAQALLQEGYGSQQNS